MNERDIIMILAGAVLALPCLGAWAAIEHSRTTRQMVVRLDARVLEIFRQAGFEFAPAKDKAPVT